MLIRLTDRTAPAPSEITPEALWRSRRDVLRGAAAGALALWLPPALAAPLKALSLIHI